jgi:predicted GIY-YIG superfamily endonuclease
MLYVLECQEGKYYIGVSDDLSVTLEAHFAGQGSPWTQQYRPVKAILTKPVTTNDDENKMTKDLMRKHGVNNVRGGSYSEAKLTTEQTDALNKEIPHRCIICMRVGHLGINCPRMVSQRSMRRQEWAYNCFDCGRGFMTTRALNAHREYYCD